MSLAYYLVLFPIPPRFFLSKSPVSPRFQEIFRALAEAGDAALVARHVFGCELCEGVEFTVTFDFVVFCHCEFCAGRGVDDLVADGYAVIKEVEAGEFRVDEFEVVFLVKSGVSPRF